MGRVSRSVWVRFEWPRSAYCKLYAPPFFRKQGGRDFQCEGEESPESADCVHKHENSDGRGEKVKWEDKRLQADKRKRIKCK